MILQYILYRSLDAKFKVKRTILTYIFPQVWLSICSELENDLYHDTTIQCKVSSNKVTCLSVCPSVYLSFYPSVCPSSVSLCLCVCLSASLSVLPYKVSLSLSVSLCFCLSGCPSVFTLLYNYIQCKVSRMSVRKSV